MSIAAWPSVEPVSTRSACSRALRRSLSRKYSRNSTARTTITVRAAEELRDGELPAYQQGADDAEFDDQAGGGDLEGHRKSGLVTTRKEDSRVIYDGQASAPLVAEALDVADHPLTGRAPHA
ncbi:hypothetical protein [Streptomyces sp. NPDC005181]|uniref:hypothetical protein n=1 Tax=Streptomyces sp. NPDC005181 TaxID=3156869 RepID=UPI0033B8E38C